MGFTKTCPVCKKVFFSLVDYMSHIKNNHKEEHPEIFVRKDGEIKWSLRDNT